MPAACRTYKVAGELARLGAGELGTSRHLSEQSPPAQKLQKEHPPAPSLISGSAAATSGIAAGISQQYDRRPGTSGDGVHPRQVRNLPSGNALSTESNTVIAS